MRIKEIHVDGFGAWSNLELRELSENLTVFYGPNEAGKTTLMQFVRGILYGYSPERRRRYLPPVQGGEPGGSLLIDSASGRVRVARRPQGDDDFGKLTITGVDGKPRNREVLPAMLSGVDESTFQNVFAVGLRELQELNALDATEASQLLYNLTTGLDRVGLMEVMEELQKSRKRIVGGGEESSELEQLLSQRRRLTDELTELEQRNRQWYETVGELTTLKQKIQAQQRENDALEQEIRTVDAALPIRQRWDDRTLLKNQLNARDQRINVTPKALDRLADLKSQIVQKKKQIKQLKGQRAKLKKEAAELGIQPRIIDAASQIEALTEQTSWMNALEQQVRQLQPLLGLTPPPGERLSLVSSVNPAGPPLPASLSAATGPKAGLFVQPKDIGGEPQVTSRVLASLRGPARTVREASKKLKHAKAERERNQIEVEEVNDRLAAELLQRREGSLKAALEKAGTLVTRLRRRIQIEERLDKMVRHRDELENDVEVLIDESILPLSGLAYPGAFFVIGFTMLITSIVYEDMVSMFHLGGTLTVMGISAIFLAILWKWNLERKAQSDLDACNRQLRALSDQIRQVQDEQDEVDRHLPQGGGSLDSRLLKAEQDLEHLQSLIPLDTDRQVAGHRNSGADRKVELAEESLAEAHDRWRTALRRNKLPETLKPSEIRDLADQTEERQEQEKQQELQKLELESRERELLTFWTRIDQLAEELRLDAKADDPKDKLRLLTQTLKEQRALQEKKASMGAKYGKLGDELKRLNNQGRRLSQQKTALFAEMGVRDEKELRKLDERKREAQRLTQKIEEESARIDVELETHEGDGELLAKLVENCDRDELEARRKRLDDELDEGQAQLQRLHQRQGATEQEVHAAGDDRRQDRLRLEIAGLNRRIGEVVRTWRVLNVSSTVLEKIRHDYENDRQPETLNVASQYLTQLTEGRYTRIWTPFGEAALRIDNDKDESLPLDVLSAGTREAVFVCLRLALASNFAERGACLPLVLDDVLVNFDVTRADAAASVLMEYANRGHQMLLFTCHEHIMEAFEVAGAEIRVLPGRGAELLEERRRKRAASETPVEPPPLPEPEVEEEPEEVIQVIDEPEIPVASPAPPVMLVVDDDMQDEIDEEMEDELLDVPEEELEEPLQPEPDFFAWKSFWFEDDDLVDFAKLGHDHQQAPADEDVENDAEDDHQGEAVWESAAMWWDGNPAGSSRPADLHRGA